MDLEKLISLVITIVSLLIAVVGQFLPPGYKEIVPSIAVGVVVAGYLGYIYFKNRRLKKSISNLGIAKKSRHIIMRLIKQTQEALAGGETAKIDRALECADSIERVLLYLGMYRDRIRLGKMIEKATAKKDTVFYKEHHIRAKIDFLGWTYVLTGKQREACRVVGEGIEYINTFLKRLESEGKTGQKIYAKILMYKLRAMRHLGSMPESKNFKEDFKHLLEAERFLEDNRENLLPLEDHEIKADSMLCGLYYGMALCKCEEMFDKKAGGAEGNLDLAKIAYGYLEQCENLIDKLDSAAPGKNLESHRRIKIKLLKDRIYGRLTGRAYEEMRGFFEGTDKLPPGLETAADEDTMQAVLKNAVDKSLEDCRKHFGGGIFVDDSMIYYLEQRADKLAQENK